MMQTKIILIFSLFFSLNIYAQKFEAFSLTGFHSTNFDSSNYKHANGWLEGRLFFNELQFDTSHTNTAIFPFVVGIGGDHQAPHERKITYGIGLQSYIISYLLPDSLAKKLPFLNSLRTFVDYSNIWYYDRKPSRGYPKNNLRYGIDIWYEYGVPDMPVCSDFKGKLWIEFWMQWAYQSTNFSEKNYKAFTFGNATRIGLNQSIINSKAMLFPYALMELTLSGKKTYWENRMITGFGIRFFPVKNWQKYLNRFAIFIESRWVVKYFKNMPGNFSAWGYSQSSFPVAIKGESLPKFDLHFGINFSLGGWWNANTQKGSVNNTTPKGN